MIRVHEPHNLARLVLRSLCFNRRLLYQLSSAISSSQTPATPTTPLLASRKPIRFSCPRAAPEPQTREHYLQLRSMVVFLRMPMWCQQQWYPFCGTLGASKTRGKLRSRTSTLEKLNEAGWQRTLDAPALGQGHSTAPSSSDSGPCPLRGVKGSCLAFAGDRDDAERRVGVPQEPESEWRRR